jgi:hypothetical protein
MQDGDVVRLYDARPGEAWLYEMGIPFVELGDDKWSINVMQKVPVERYAQKFSIIHVLLFTVKPRIARWRPSGDGIP